MQSSLEKIEEILFDYAYDYTPPGSLVKAIVSQWIHAIAFNHDLFAKDRGANKNIIIELLQDNSIYTNKKQFQKLVESFIHLKQKKIKEFTFIDLFAGIGGMRIGFEKEGGKCVFSSEFDKNAQLTYAENYGEYPFGDITNISENDIPQHDILLAGFPCQPFSHAGLKLGIDDTRGTLFYDIARIISKKRPKVALLENVKGLISHDKGYTLKTILNTLTDIGYRCIISSQIIKGDNIEELKKQAKGMVLKSYNFGVPQNRQRIYMVIWQDELSASFSYPQPIKKVVTVGDILESNPDVKFTISDKLWDGHRRRKKQNKINGKGFGYGLVTPESIYTNTISARYYKDGSEILIFQENLNPRKLTQREAARLQGFPEKFKINPSGVQAYKQFGNSVSVPVIQQLAKNIKNQIIKK